LFIFSRENAAELYKLSTNIRFNLGSEALALESTKESIRESIIELLGEGAWQYGCYNFDLKELIMKSVDNMS